MGIEQSDWEQRVARLERLLQVSNVIHSTLEPVEALHLILDQAVRLMRASSGSVVLLNPTTQRLEIQASRGLSPRSTRIQLQLGEGVTGWVAHTGQAARVDDVLQDARYVAVRPRVRSELAVPLEVHGEVRGVINVDADRVGAFSAADQELLEALSVQAARVIQNTWLYEQLRLKAQLFESLVNVGQTINSANGLEEALRRITREACQLMEARMASLLLVDRSGEWLDLQASHGAGAAYLNKPRLSVEDSLVGVVVRRKKPIQIENVQTSARYQNVEVARQEGLVSLLSVPLIFGGQATGALNVYKGEPHRFSNEEIRILGALADLSALAIEKARLDERIVELEDQSRRHERLSALGLLAAEVAHEIRNPLTVMKMLYHSLDLRFPAKDPRARDVQVMADKMDQLNRIVERVLDFARTNEPELAPTDLRQLLDEVGLLTRHKLQQHGIRVVYRVQPDLARVLADGAQLAQAFLNLVLNAVDAMPDGGVLTLAARYVQRTGAPEDVGHAVVEFRDTGHGMTREQQARAFTSLLSSSKSKGTGLGLAIVARIAEAHHGRVSVHSRRGKGTTFRIELPLRPPE